MTLTPFHSTPEFKALTWHAQWIYYNALRAGAGPTRCGVVDLWPKRYAELSPDVTEQDVIEWAKELAESGAAIYDDTTDELMLPGYMAAVTPAKNDRKVIAVVNALQAVRSPLLAAAAVAELKQLRDENPDAPVWNDPRAVAALEDANK
jgi:hypothetical protein